MDRRKNTNKNIKKHLEYYVFCKTIRLQLKNLKRDTIRKLQQIAEEKKKYKEMPIKDDIEQESKVMLL